MHDELLRSRQRSSEYKAARDDAQFRGRGTMRRSLEPVLRWVPVEAQYLVVARKHQRRSWQSLIDCIIKTPYADETYHRT